MFGIMYLQAEFESRFLEQIERLRCAGERLRAALNKSPHFKGTESMDPVSLINALIAEVTKVTGIMDSATAYIKGVPALIQAAIAAAIANGATAAQLLPLSTLATTLDASAVQITAAIAANSPAP